MTMPSIFIRHLDMLPRAVYRRVGCDLTQETAIWVAATCAEFTLVAVRTDDGLLAPGLVVLTAAWEAIAPDVAIRDGA